MSRNSQDSVLPSARIREILIEPIDAQKQSVGFVIGAIEGSGRRIVSYGKLANDDDRESDGRCVFEIGSTAKVLTALIMAKTKEAKTVLAR
jgi:serine-type D-Ala-D-Ala carboxypeptidase/endopeptidase